MPAIHYRLQQVDTSPSNSELDARIEELRRQIEDDTHKVIADVENKYSVKNPGSTFSDVQFPLTQVLHRSCTALDDLEKSIVDLEAEVGTLNIGPRTKLDALRSFTAHLQELYDVEEIYKRVNEYDIAHDYAHGMKVLCEAIPKLAGIAGSKDGKVQKVAETMVDDFCFKKVYFVHNLKESFRKFISCSGADSGKTISLTIHSVKKEKMNEILEALSLADSLDSEMDNILNLILEGFCSRIVESQDPSEAVKIQKNPEEITFNVSKNISKEASEPLEIVKAITVFLKTFGEAIQGYKTDSQSFALLLGIRLRQKLADLVIKKCLTPAVPYEKEKIQVFEEVKKASDDLHSLMINLGFFSSDSVSFSAFSENFDQIFINRRCARICEKARDLALETCSEEIEVGTTTDNTVDDDLKEFVEDFENKTGLKNGKLDIESSSQLPKILQFRKCKIAKNVKLFGDLLTKTLDEASSAESSVASGKLLTTGSNIVRIFLMASSKSHDQVIKAVPLFGALFYNGCHYISHILILSSLNLKAKLPKELVNHANFISLITELRQVAADTLEGHLLHMRRDISTLIGPDDIFANLMNASALSDCRKVVESCLRQVKQVSDVWKGVFSDAVYVRAVGAIISHTLGVLVEVVLTKEDITEADSTHMAEELSRLLKEFEKIMTVNKEPTIGAICEKEYHRTKEVLFCLKESLMNIADRWCNGKGPLAHWMKPDEVMTSGNSKLAEFRSLFKGTGIKAYVLPSTDAHQSEYLADRDFRVRFLSGFGGSNAFTVITEEKALLWTDGRYFIQAVNEFEPGWELMKQGVPESVEPSDWLTVNLESGDLVGFDPTLFGISQGITFVKSLKEANLVPTPLKENLVDKIWRNRPEAKIEKITTLSKEESGKCSKKKIEELREKFLKKKCDSYLLTSLDDIVWLLNIRGFDIPYNPLVFSVLFITLEEVHFFVDKRKLGKSEVEFLKDVCIHEYEEAESFIRNFEEERKSKKEHKVYIADSTNYFLGTIVPEEKRIIGVSHVQAMKAVKNKVEIEGIRDCHIRDSGAIVKFLLWLKKEVLEGKKLTEAEAGKKMDDLREEIEKFVSLSFTTISAVDHHAALPHYHATEEEGKIEVKKESVFLLDSGGHYRDGTTDVTRTVCFGDKIDPYFSKMFTLVLRGHIDNAAAHFPDGINGSRLDILARKLLWDEGYDFGHGVGHGVGHFLNVHEGPIGIGYRSVRPDGGLHAGQVITIEPGYYETNRFGIRIENCYEIVASGPLPSEATNFLTFESLTWVPIQRELINKSFLDQKHIDWINEYHRKCLEKVGPYLKKRGWNEEYNFLEDWCKKI